MLSLFSVPVYNTEEYKITQKIISHYRKKGYYGVKYKSFYADGCNFTFFDEYINNFSWEDSRVVLNYATSNLFISLDQEEKCQDIDNIDTYLYISVRNESFRFQARNKDLNRVSLNELLPLMEEEDEGSPEEHLELKEMREMLDKAIDELPEKCRLVFLMSREEGLKTKEIAEILSVQESTVRVQMKIAIEKLVARLKPSFPNISFSLLLMFIFNVIYRSA